MREQNPKQINDAVSKEFQIPAKKSSDMGREISRSSMCLYIQCLSALADDLSKKIIIINKQKATQVF